MIKTTLAAMTALLLTTGMALAQPDFNPAHGSQAQVPPPVSELMLGSTHVLLGQASNGDRVANDANGAARNGIQTSNVVGNATHG
jgi:hypothetical protein